VFLSVFACALPALHARAQPRAPRAAAAAAAPRTRPHALPHPRLHAHTHAHTRPAHCLHPFALQVSFFPRATLPRPRPTTSPAPFSAAAPRAKPGRRRRRSRHARAPSLTSHPRIRSRSLRPRHWHLLYLPTGACLSRPCSRPFCRPCQCPCPAAGGVAWHAAAAWRQRPSHATHATRHPRASHYTRSCARSWQPAGRARPPAGRAHGGHHFCGGRGQAEQVGGGRGPRRCVFPPRAPYSRAH
jgi:hypothetical protein